MKLVSISAQNFGGIPAFEFALSGVNAIVGRNFGGKTRIANAIKVLLLGYLPDLGKKNSATFGLASGRSMTVSGTFDNGMRITRTFRVSGDSVKQEADVPAEIEALGTLAFTLNADDYFALSERERVAYVFANLPLAGAPDPRRTVIDAIADRSVERVARVVEAVFGKPGTNARLPVQSQIEIALAAATENAKSAREYAVRMEKGAQAVETLRLQDAPQVDLAALRSEKDAAAAEVEAMSLRRGELVAQRRAEEANDSRRRRLRGDAVGQTAAAFGSEVQRLRDALAAIDARKPEDGATAEDVRSAAAEVRDQENAAERCDWESATLRASLAESEKALAAAEHAETCPYCATPGTAWKDRKVGELRSAVAGMRAKLDQLGAHKLGLIGSIEQARGRRDAWEKEVAARAQDERSRAAAVGALSVAETRGRRLAQIEAELAEIPAPADHGREVEEVDGRLSRTRARIAEIDDLLRSQDRRANDLRRIAEAEKQRDDAREDLALGVAVLEALRGLQANLVEAAFGPLLDRANRIFGHLLPTPLAYHEGELGSWRDGIWVSHRIFSGTEKALAYASLQAALAAGSPIKVMILDELGRLDEANARRMMDAAHEAVNRGDIDTFVGIDASRTGFYRDHAAAGGWMLNAIEIGGAS